MNKRQRSEHSANQQLKAGAKYGHQPHKWPRAARPTWGTMAATGKPLWAWKLFRPATQEN